MGRLAIACGIGAIFGIVGPATGSSDGVDPVPPQLVAWVENRCADELAAYHTEARNPLEIWRVDPAVAAPGAGDDGAMAAMALARAIFGLAGERLAADAAIGDIGNQQATAAAIGVATDLAECLHPDPDTWQAIASSTGARVAAGLLVAECVLPGARATQELLRAGGDPAEMHAELATIRSREEARCQGKG